MARLIALPVAGLASLLPLRWIDADRSLTEFAFLTVVYGLPLLFTFGELGYGGVASSVVGAEREHPERAGRAVGAIATLYLGIAAVVSLLVVLGQLAGGAEAGPGRWLGFPQLGTPAMVALVLAALGIPASLGARVLIGLDRAVLVVGLQAVPAVLSAVLVFVMLQLDAPTSLLAAALILGGLLVNLPLTVAGILAVRGRLVWPSGLRSGLASGGFPAWPNFASAASAIALSQVPRLVLAHRGSDTSVAELGLALVFFVPAASLVFVSGQALWSDFAFANARNELTREHVLAAVRHSAVLGVIFAVGFAVAGPIAAHIFTPGIPAPISMYIAQAALLLAFAVDLPLNVAMLTGPMASRRGFWIVLQFPVSLLLSIVIPGPTAVLLIWIQTVTLLLVVFAPSLWYCLRDQQRAREPAGAA